MPTNARKVIADAVQQYVSENRPDEWDLSDPASLADLIAEALADEGWYVDGSRDGPSGDEPGSEGPLDGAVSEMTGGSQRGAGGKRPQPGSSHGGASGG